MAPKMSPGTPRERPKTRPKKQRKIIEKRVMQVTQGHAGHAAELGQGGGVPPKPCGGASHRSTLNPRNTPLGAQGTVADHWRTRIRITRLALHLNGVDLAVDI